MSVARIVSLLLGGCFLAVPMGGAASSTTADQLARAQEDKDQASVVEICRRELEGHGGNTADLLMTMFHAQVELDDYTRAGQTLDRLEKLDPPPAPGQVADLRGDLAAAAKKPVAQTIPLWREALKSHPGNATAILGKIADAFDRDGRWPEAVEALRAFLRAQPDHAARRTRLAECLLNTGDADAADKEMAAANRLDAADETVKAVGPIFDRLRPNLSALRALGSIAAKAKTGGTYDFRTGAKTPEAAHLDRALIFYRAGAFQAALSDLTPAAEATGGTSMAIRLLQAQCLWRLNQSEDAAALRVAKISDDGWFDNRPRLDRLRVADTPAGSEGLNARQHIARAGVLLDANQPVLVLEDVEAGIRAGEKSGPLANEAQIVLAAALFQNGRNVDALAAAERATEMDPRSADAWAVRGHFEQDAHADLTAAVTSLDRALAIRNDPQWLRRREACLRTLGRNAEADRDASRLAATGN